MQSTMEKIILFMMKTSITSLVSGGIGGNGMNGIPLALVMILQDDLR